MKALQLSAHKQFHPISEYWLYVLGVFVFNVSSPIRALSSILAASITDIQYNSLYRRLIIRWREQK